MRFLLPLLVLALLVPGLVRAAPVPGQAVADRLAIAGKQIPLPAGEWQVVGYARDPIADRPATDGAIESVALFQWRGPAVAAFVMVHVNERPAAGGWGLSGDCTRADIHLAILHYATTIDGACSFINHVVSDAPAGASSAWTAARARAAAQGWVLPPTWVMAGFRITDRRDVVDVRYHFNPSLWNIAAAPAASWRDNDWAPARVAADPARAAAAAGLVRWIAGTGPAVEAGLRNRLPWPVALPWPVPAEPTATESPATESPAVQPTAAAEDASTLGWGIGLVKTASWRVIGTLGDLAVAYLFTGDPLLSGGLALTGAVLNSALYFGHELAWNRVGAAANQPPLLEFAAAGRGM